MLSDEHKMIRDAARDFAQNEIAPRRREFDTPGEHKFPWDIVDDVAELGFMAPHFPEDVGGSGADLMSTILVHEEFNRADPGIGTAVLGPRFGAEVVEEFGTEEQRQEWVLPVVEGEMVTGASITEPGAGSDVASIRTTAEKNGDEYVLNGSKTFASQASIADYMVVAAKTSPDEGLGGITTFIVTTDTDGFVVENDIDKMGHRAAPTCEISLKDVPVHESDIVGEIDEGFYQLMNLFNNNRLFTAANALGTMEGAFDHAYKYAGEREAFGQSISEFQGMQWKFADMMTKIETSRSLLYRTIFADDDENIDQLASMCKYYVPKVCEDVCTEAIQVHGGYGFTREFPVEKFYRDSRVYQIYEGTNEIQKNTIYKNYE